VPTRQAARPMAGRALLTATAGVPPALRPVAAHRCPPPRPQRAGRRDGARRPRCATPCSSLVPEVFPALIARRTVDLFRPQAAAAAARVALRSGALGRARSDAPMHLDPSAPNFTRSSYIKLAVRFCIARDAHHCAAMVDKRLNAGSIEYVESRQHSASKCAGRGLRVWVQHH
jgi:hypothetical protein